MTTEEPMKYRYVKLIDGPTILIGEDGKEAVETVKSGDKYVKAVYIADARRKALEEAARIVEGWHIKKGGYSALAETIRAAGGS